MTAHEVPLGDILELERIPIDIGPDVEYRQIGVRSFGNGVFHREPCLGSELSKLRYFEIHPGRLVVSNIMAWEGAIGLTTPAETGFVGSARFLSYRPIGNVDIRYLNYYLQSSEGRSLIRAASTGTGTRNQTLLPRNFGQIKVPLPRSGEQRRIADKLDSMMSRLSTISAAFPDSSVVPNLATYGLDRLLSRWASGMVKVGEVCSLTSDTIHPGSDAGPAKEFVGLEHITPHLGNRVGSRPLGDEKGRKLRFRPGDVLYGYLRPYLNKVWLADRHGLCSVEQYVLRPNGSLSGELIAAALRSRATLNQVLAATHSLQLPRRRSGLLLALEIPHISPGNQKRAVTEVSEFMHKVRTLKECQVQRDRTQDALRPTVLRAAFSGRL
jgi:hypothetical protein